MDRKDDTMNLDALKELLSDVPDSGEFDLDAIIAEVEGGAPAAPRETPRPAPEPPRTAAQPQEPAPAPRMEAAQTAHAPKTRQTRREEPVQQFPDPAAFEDEADEEEEYDPRAARIAAREAKAAAKREKAAAKAAAKEARRAAKLAARAAEDEEEFDDIPPMPEEMQPAQARPMQEEIPEQAQVPKQRMTRKEARAARIAAEQAEEEEEILLRDPAQAAQACKRRARGLSARAMIVLILAAAAAYLSLAPSFGGKPGYGHRRADAAAVHRAVHRCGCVRQRVL